MHSSYEPVRVLHIIFPDYSCCPEALTLLQARLQVIESGCAILAVQVQRCTLLSIKTGGCPETCNYCSQSSSWSKTTGTKAEKLMDLEEVYQVGGGSAVTHLPR